MQIGPRSVAISTTLAVSGPIISETAELRREEAYPAVRAPLNVLFVTAVANRKVSLDVELLSAVAELIDQLLQPSTEDRVGVDGVPKRLRFHEKLAHFIQDRPNRKVGAESVSHLCPAVPRTSVARDVARVCVRTEPRATWP